LRGQIVTAIDLGIRLTDRTERARENSMNLVVNSPDGVVSLLVDQIGDVLEADQNLMETVPPTVRSIKAEYLKSVCKLNDRLLIILDIDKIIATVSSHQLTVSS